MLKKLKEALEQRDIKNKDLADILGISNSAISKRLMGNVTFTESEKNIVLSILDSTDIELFTDDNSTPNKTIRNNTIFTERLKEAIKKSGKKQKDIAKALKTTERTISDWKLGKQIPKYENLANLCKELNVSIDYLTGRSKVFKSFDDELKEIIEYEEEFNKSTISSDIDSLVYDLLGTDLELYRRSSVKIKLDIVFLIAEQLSKEKTFPTKLDGFPENEGLRNEIDFDRLESFVDYLLEQYRETRMSEMITDYAVKTNRLGEVLWSETKIMPIDGIQNLNKAIDGEVKEIKDKFAKLK